MKRKLILLVTMIIFVFLLVGCVTNVSEASDNKAIERVSDRSIYEYVDPDTGVHYLIYSEASSRAGMGGMAPRLNSDGSVMTDKYK